MQGMLGEKIGEGATSDVYAWAPGQVVKLFKAGAAQGFGFHEAIMTRAVFAAGGPALEVLEDVRLDGRFGFVLPRLTGPSLLQLWQSGEVTSEEAGAILARLYLSVHRSPPPKDVPRLRDWFAALSQASGLIPKRIATAVLARIERLPDEDALCHGDLHPGNVIMTADGPKIIDWSATVRAPAAFDLWRGDFHLKDFAYAPEAGDVVPAAALNAAARSEYARLAGMSADALAIEPYLPVLCAVALAERALASSLSAVRERLIQRLEAVLQ
jgi:hypothetical protein